MVDLADFKFSATAIRHLMPTEEPCLVYVSEELLDLPVPSVSDDSSAWPNSDSEDEVEPTRPAAFGQFEWSSCLADTKCAVAPLNSRPRAPRPDWTSAGSKRVVALLASGSTLAVASQDGTITLFRAHRDAEVRKPEMGKRKVSDRSLHSVGGMMPPVAYARPRKASATISVTDVDVSGAVRKTRSGKGAAAEALVAVSPHGADPPSPKRASVSSPIAGRSSENLDDTASLASLPMSPDMHSPPGFAADFRPQRMEPFAQTVVGSGVSTIIDLLPAERSDICLALTSDGSLDRLSLIDGGLCDTLRLESAKSLELRHTQILRMGSTDYAFIFTASATIYAVCVNSHHLVCRLQLPQPATSAAIVESQQGDLLVAYTAAASSGIEFLPLVSIAQSHQRSPHSFMLAAPHRPIALQLQEGAISDLRSHERTLLCVVEGRVLTIEVDEQLPSISKQSGNLSAVVILTSSSEFAVLRCRDASVTIVKIDGDDPKDFARTMANFSAREIEAASFANDSTTCLAIRTNEVRRLLSLSVGKAESMESATEIFSSPSSTAAPMIRQVLSLDDMHLFGYSSGHVVAAELGGNKRRLSTWSLGSPITALSWLAGLQSSKRYAAGSERGEVAVFDQDLSLLQTWSVFTSPVIQMALLQHDNVGRLNGSLIIMSANCTTAFIAIDDPSASIMSLPGSRTPLREIRVRQDDIILSYASGLWRQWDAQSSELRRSVQEPLAALPPEEAGQWWTYTLRSSAVDDRGPLAIPLNVRPLIKSLPALSTLKRLQGSAPGRYHLLKMLLADLLPTRIDNAIDSLLERIFKVEECHADSFVLAHRGRLSQLRRRRPASILQISARITVSRLLPALCILRFLTNFADCEHATRSASEALTTSFRLGRSGNEMLSDAMLQLAAYWSDTNNEIQGAARTVIESTISRLTNEAAVAQATHWHTQVFLRDEISASASPAFAMLLLSLIAIQHFDRLEPGMLLATAHCIVEAISSEDGQSRLLATELFGRGLQLWQNQLDLLPAIANLIDLGFAESDDGGGSADRELRQAARQALLQVVSVNLTLFSSAVNVEGLHSASTRHRIAVMRLIAFIIRKKPILLLSSVPKVVEAAVKALDPLSRTARSTVQPAATFLLQELVKTYPSISFHESTQRLAAGNPDGGVIMYDVKSATRLYVLDFHQKPVTAVSFAPDGRRLVTVALDEARIAVWKVGSSLLGMLHAGGPPRQGAQGTSKPYQTYDFVHAEEDLHMITASTLHLVSWDWPLERTARLRIRATQLTFPTA